MLILVVEEVLKWIVFLARSCPSVGTEDNVGEDGKPLWVLSAGVSSLSSLTRGGGDRDGDARGGQAGRLVREGRTRRAIRKLIHSFVQKPEYWLH
jgi:hypothetical protein